MKLPSISTFALVLTLAITLSCFLSPAPTYAWQTFSYEGGVMKNGKISSGAAIKLGPVGIAFGLGDQSDVNTKRMSELPFNAMATGIDAANTTKLNHKRTDASWGFDLRYHYDIGKTVSLYAGPGLYWNEYRNLTLVTQQTSGNSYAPGYLFTEKKRNELEVTGNGGILVNVLSNDMWGLTLGAGYHTYRGAYLSLGLSYF